MKPFRLILVLLPGLLLLLTSACGPQPTTTSPLSAALNEVSGTVTGKQAGEASFHPVAVGEIVQVHGQVQTGDDGRARMDLSSGTILRIAPSSLFTLESNEPAQGGLATKIKLELGRIFIVLSGGSVEVETPSGVASVLGSYLMVEVDSANQNVTAACLEGKCAAGSLTFTDGQKAVFVFDPATGGYRAPTIEDMDNEDFQKWLDETPEARRIVNDYLAAHPRSTATLIPSSTPTLVPSLTPTIVAASTDACFHLLTPPDGANLSGLVTFSWEAKSNAAQYRLTFVSPFGAKNILATADTSLSNYIEILPTGGTYSWNVTAFDASGAPICDSNTFTFSKQTTPTLVPVKPTQEKIVCTYANAQWEFPNQPCYCDPYKTTNNPPYCYGSGY